MSAIPSPATVAAPRRIGLPAGLATAGRTAVLLFLVLLVPGEAARVGSDLRRN